MRIPNQTMGVIRMGSTGTISTTKDKISPSLYDKYKLWPISRPDFFFPEPSCDIKCGEERVDCWRNCNAPPDECRRRCDLPHGFCLWECDFGVGDGPRGYVPPSSGGGNVGF